LVIYKVRPHVEGLLAARALFEEPYVQGKALNGGHSEDKGPRTRGKLSQRYQSQEKKQKMMTSF
jgi:hypothetical protein